MYYDHETELWFKSVHVQEDTASQSGDTSGFSDSDADSHEKEELSPSSSILGFEPEECEERQSLLPGPLCDHDMAGEPRK